MYRLLFKSFFRTKMFLISLVLLLVIGIISILIGKQYLIKQQENVAAAQQFQNKSLKQNIEYHNDDLGLLLYYQRFAFIKEPSNITALSIGQSDVNPSLQAVTIRGLEGQKYDTDFENPSLLMSGNLDLGFVIIYLFPLVLIAMLFNIYSEEKELGTWRIVASQTSGKATFLTKKIWVRSVFVLSVYTLLMVVAVITLQISTGQNVLAIYVQGFLYLLFWVALCFWIVSLRKNSNVNALLLIASWVVLTILVPAVVNNYVINKYQVPEALNAMLEQRDGYHEKWDLEKDATMTGFYEVYPEYKEYTVPEDEFSWIWYYGMQHSGDMESAGTSAEMTEKIMLRTNVSKNIAQFIPTMHAQLSFNNLAGTDMESHVEFLKALTHFHENLRVGFYSKIFDKDPVNSVRWKKYDASFYQSEQEFNWFRLIIPTFLITIVLAFLGVLNLKKL